MKKPFIIAILILLITTNPFYSQIWSDLSINRKIISTRPTSNTINDIFIKDNQVWIGTGKELMKTTDLGVTWTTYNHKNGLGRGGVSAIAGSGDTLWVATAFDSTTSAGVFPAGGGLSFSTDNGNSWTWIPQPIDSIDEDRYRPTTTVIQNLTYDIAISDSAVWIASWGGGLRKSTDMGKTWEVVTVDSLPFDVLNHLNHMAFSVMFDGNALWVGSAGGIHKSTDGGKSWTTFNHQNQSEPISGNFVVAIANQSVNGSSIVWAATIEALGSTEYRAVSITQDGGLTWKTTLDNIFAHNFCFDPNTHAAYVASDSGLYMSTDTGQTWDIFPQIIDNNTGERLFTKEFYSVGVGSQNTLWLGSSDGLAISRDSGTTWEIVRAFPIPGENKTPDTFAYPNPFSPLRHNRYEGDGYVRFQYSTKSSTTVTVKIYDFGMNLVKCVVRNKQISTPGTYSEAWNGRNESGELVANGVYFYKITFSGGKTLWGKVIVIN